MPNPNITITHYQPKQHYLIVSQWIQQRTRQSKGLDGFMLDRWETQFSPERLADKSHHNALVFKDDQLSAVIACEGDDEFHLLQIGPDFEIFKAMFHWVSHTQSGHSFSIWIAADNTWQQEQLQTLGAHLADGRCCNRRMQLSKNVPVVQLPEPYRLIDIDIRNPKRAQQQAAIDQDCFPWAQSNVQFVQQLLHMPTYPKAIHKGVVNKQNELVAFSILWPDAINQMAVFEPVATIKQHRRKGIAKALMNAMIRQAFTQGMRTFSVGSYSDEAHATYESVGFSNFTYSNEWRVEPCSSAPNRC